MNSYTFWINDLYKHLEETFTAQTCSLIAHETYLSLSSQPHFRFILSVSPKIHQEK